MGPAGGRRFPPGARGTLSASASASSDAQNQSGSIATTASTPRSGTAGALSEAAIGPALESAAIAAGHVVSNAVLTPSGTGHRATGRGIGAGAVSAAYGGESGLAVTYEATATFDFTPPKSEALDLYLSSFDFAGLGFDSMSLRVQVNDDVPHSYTFLSLTGSGGAEKFFTANKNEPLPLDTVAAGSRQSVELVYDLTYNIGTLAQVGDGFGFTYALATPTTTAFDLAAPSAIPEASTWAMMLVGFAGLAWAGHRTARRSAAKST